MNFLQPLPSKWKEHYVLATIHSAQYIHIDETFATQAGILLEVLPVPQEINTLDGRLLAGITHQTPSEHLSMSLQSLLFVMTCGGC